MLRFLLKCLVIGAALGTLIIAAVTLYIVPRLPDIDTLRDVRMQVPLRVYSQDQSLIAEYGEKRRVPVAIENAPQQLLNAFIAAEDARFYEHPGVDWQGITRAAISLLMTGEKKQGGSTITMQVARNFFLSREKSYLRKLNEIFLAFKIETQLEKDEILELYINKIYLGQRAYGVGAAARVYYGTDINSLSLAQLAMIAGLPKAPSKSNPISNPEQAKIRRAYVLRRMNERGFISDSDFQEANNSPLTASLHSPSIELEAPYVAEMVRSYLTEQYGDEAYTEGYIVTTTIRDKNQRIANLSLRNALLEYDERHGYRGAEHHYDLTETDSEEQWQGLLDPYSSIGSLYPALVIDVQDQTISCYLTGIGIISIEWDGLVWARRYINENLRGAAPKFAEEILSVGDVIRVIEDENGNWRLSQIPEIEGSLVSLDSENGAVLALVGGFDFYRSKFNRVIQANRQPGSSFKPFIYSAAMENGFSVASIINDAPVVFDDPSIGQKWRPENYSGKTFGPTPLREALRHSRNLVSIRLLNRMGVRNALEHIEKFGFDTSELPENLSLALGSGAVSPWQLASSYAVIANGGYKIEPHYISEIVTYDGETILHAEPPVVCRECNDEQEPLDESLNEEPEPVQINGADDSDSNVSAHAVQVVNSQNIWIIHSLLKDVVRRGTGRKAYQKLGREDLAGKTGTTNDQHDAWFAGFNPRVVTVAWVGFDKFQPLGRGEVGGRAALPMWIEYMRVALEDIPESHMDRPTDLVNVRINPKQGCKTAADDPMATFEVFKQDQLGNITECETFTNPFVEQNQTEEAPETLF